MHKLPIQRCISLLQLKPTFPTNQIKQIHAQLITNNTKSPAHYAKLIEHYCASPARRNASRILSHFEPPSVFLLNVSLRCDLPRSSICAFAKWVRKDCKDGVVFDVHTYVFALGACARCENGALWEGKQVHCRVMKCGLASDVKLQTTLIHFYANNREIWCAKKVFDEMPERSVASWNCLISGYCAQRERVLENGKNAVLLFREMLVSGCRAEPNDTTMVCVLSAAARLGCLETGVCIHGYVEKVICDGENDVYIGTGLVDMYAKCGSLDSAMYIFTKMSDRNVLTWTAMMTGLAVHGRAKQALELLSSMKDHRVKPNSVTFTSLLFACCHTGLLEEGLFLFHSMEREFSITPLIHHYGCIVHLLGQAGHLQEAFKFISSMRVKRDAVLWRSLLHACNVHRDVLMGEKVARVLIAIEQDESCAEGSDRSQDYVALSNICASAERWDDVAMVRELIDLKGLEIKPASSVVLGQ